MRDGVLLSDYLDALDMAEGSGKARVHPRAIWVDEYRRAADSASLEIY